jgi:hypothetical protein
LVQLREAAALQQPSGSPTRDDDDDDEAIVKQGREADDSSGENSDAELEAMLDGMDSDPELERIESERRAEMERAKEHLHVARLCGFGVHRLVQNELEAISIVSEGSRVVCHVCDPNSTLSAHVDFFLETEAIHYPGTQFIRVHPAMNGPLMQLLHISQLGNTAAFTDGSLVQCLRNLGNFGSEEQFSPGSLRTFLDRTHVLVKAMPQRAILDARASYFTSQPEAAGDDEEDFFDCGVDGCMKKFPHEHVGSTVPREFNADAKRL